MGEMLQRLVGVLLLWSVVAGATRIGSVKLTAQENGAADASQANAEFFVKNVGPIFESRCWECHSGPSAEGDLRLDTSDGIFAGADNEPLLVAGDPDHSRLIEMVVGEPPQMPQSGKPLGPDEIESIRQWISGGGQVPESWPESINRPGSNLWSLAPIQRPPIPQVQDRSWPTNEIDYFILARLEQNHLVPSLIADRRTLIRRLMLDVWGLPPDPSVADQFVTETGAPAFSELVDRMLSSPHYGERAARYWLDVVRFAESNGFETNLPRANSWLYRDYVIAAMNGDRPYDQFVQEQLAGDVLGRDEATGFLVAGAWDQVKSPDPVLTANQRADELHDMVSTTGSTFLGLTVGCARCHDHKFDPIRQTDYYSLVACFAGVQHGDRPMHRERSQDADIEIAAIREQLSHLEEKLRAREPISRTNPPASNEAATSATGESSDSDWRVRPAVNPRRNVERFDPVQAKKLKFSVLKTTGLEPCLDEIEVFGTDDPLRNIALSSAGARPTASSVLPNSEIHKVDHINDGQFGNEHSWISNETGSGWIQIEFPEIVTIDRVHWARDRHGAFGDRLTLEYLIEVSSDGMTWQPVSGSADRRPFDANHVGKNEFQIDDPPSESQALLVQWLASREQFEARLTELTSVPLAYAGRFEPQPEVTHRFFRGDPMQPREVVQPGAIAAVPISFELPADAREIDRRLALARWIVEPANPLTARVIVNRLWQNHFGEGLVATPSDFGANGSAPSHPELLDWLAAELIEHHWSLKHIHRLILNSTTYRQASTFREAGMALDANSRLLWRFPPRRLEAEAIRDSILAVSGALDLSMGGPGFSVFEPNDNYVRVYEPLKEFGPAQWRRMVYATNIRQRPDGDFGVFDCPDGGQSAPKRNRSTTPIQALNLLNGPFMLQQSKIWAARLEREAGPELSEQIRLAFELAFQREPSQAELQAGLDLASMGGVEAVCRALFCSNEFVYLF